MALAPVSSETNAPTITQPAPAARKPAKRAAPAKKTAAPTGHGYLNLAQLEALAMHAGATADEAVTLAAIAMAESNGFTGSHNTNAGTGDNSYGLWQINMLGDMGPQRRQWLGLSTNDELFDPLTNARAAVKLLRADNGFGDWTTYTSGDYQQYLNDAQTALPRAAKVNVSRIKAAPAPAATSGGSVAASQPESVKQYLDNPDVAAQYGYLSAYLKDKEIGPILAQAAKEGWGENRLLGALEKTRWWQKTSQSARQWQSQQRLDPATARQQLNQTINTVQQTAQSTLGRALDPQRATLIANTAIAHGWNQSQVQQAVGAEFHYDPTKTPGGLAGQTVNTLKQHADQYLVPLSNQTLNQWARGVLKGTYKDTDFDSYLKAQASSLYPTLKAALDSGVTVKQYLDPYAQLVQTTLGQNPDGINWMDPKWSKALNTTTPDGQRAPMSLSDWGSYLRGLPEYQYTDQAKQTAQGMATTLLQTFGKVT